MEKDCNPQDSCGLVSISSTVLPQIDVLAGDLTEGVSELFTRKTRLRVNTR